jgi:hypothetical protein
MQQQISELTTRWQEHSQFGTAQGKMSGILSEQMVKLPLCLIKNYATKCGGRYSSTILNFDTRGVTLVPGKGRPGQGGWVGHRAGLDGGKEIHLLSLLGIEPWPSSLQPTATQTELSQLITLEYIKHI